MWYSCVVRLLNAFAEEQATEDAVYYMGEALRKGVIELDVFLKVSILTTTTTVLQPLYGSTICLQCFNAVGWAAGRASSL